MSQDLLAFSRETDASVRQVKSCLDILTALISDRLYLQHWICITQTGFLIHPAIPSNQEGLKIADVACGTGYAFKLSS